MTKILLADDHDITRSGLKFFIPSLVPDVTIDEACDADSTLEKVNGSDYALIMLDVKMPGSDSFELLAKILCSKPGTRILMFSMYPEYAYAKRYLQLGAKGYISKDAPTEEIGNAITAVLDDKRYMSTSLKQSIGEEIIAENINPFDCLSAREFEIVQHLIKGTSLTEIQQALNLKSSTISTYKARIFEKLQCRNSIELVKLAEVYNIYPGP